MRMGRIDNKGKIKKVPQLKEPFLQNGSKGKDASWLGLPFEKDLFPSPSSKQGLFFFDLQQEPPPLHLADHPSSQGAWQNLEQCR